MKHVTASACLALVTWATNLHSAPPAPSAALSPARVASPAAAPAPVPNALGMRPRQRRRKPIATPSDAPQRPAADVDLSLDAPTQRGPWTIRLTNRGDVPVRVIADARLLSLDVTPRGAANPRHCELPIDMRPADPLERSLTLPPKRAYAETFEPRLYCFDGKDLDALAGGAIVVAHLGRAGSSEGLSFAVVSALDGVKPEVGDRKFLESPAIRLSDEPPSVISTPAGDGSDVARLSLTGPETVDAESSDAMGIPLTLRNGGSRPLVVRFRPEMLSFDVVGPSGIEHCSWPVVAAAPLPELFTTLPAQKGSAELVVDLDAYCLGPALDHRGLAVVWAKLDTRTGSGESIGIRSSNGQVRGRSPIFVRLHRGRFSEPLRRPHVEGP